jgi:Uma2 family endonuclease
MAEETCRSAVLNAPPTKKFIPDDLLRLPDQGKGYELVDGELKEMDASFLSSFVAGRIFAHLSNHVEAGRLGWVTPEGTSYRCFPDDPSRVRRADAAFHRLDRLTAAQASSEGHCTAVPDLVVEVISPNDLADDVEEKRIEWLDAGAKLVWVVHPVQQTIHVYTAGAGPRVLRQGGTLTGEPILPDFQILLDDLFRLPTAS